MSKKEDALMEAELHCGLLELGQCITEESTLSVLTLLPYYYSCLALRLVDKTRLMPIREQLGEADVRLVQMIRQSLSGICVSRLHVSCKQLNFSKIAKRVV